MLIGPRSAPSRRAPGVVVQLAGTLCVAVLLFGSRDALGQQFRFWESFGFGKAKFGLGSSYLSELQKSLTISSSSGTVTIHDLDLGTTETSPLDGDPRLLNRKFDIEWAVNGPGVTLPIQLPSPRAASWAELSPRVTFQVLDGDFDLRFLNQREVGVDDSLHGRGLLYSLEAELTGNLCQNCPWSAEGGYRFQKLPSADVDRSQSFASPGLQVLNDASRLSRETHDVFTRFGYSFTGKDIVAYTGVRHRWANVEVEDELRLLNPPFNQETTLSSKTKLGSSATEAIVGVEAHRGSFIGRTEITFNERDYGLLAMIVYTGSFAPPPGETEEKLREREVAAEIARKLRLIRSDFLGVFDSFPEVVPLAKVEELLHRTEENVLAVFPFPEFAATQDYFRALFFQSRDVLNKIASTPATYVASDSRNKIAPAALGSRRSVSSVLAIMTGDNSRKTDFLVIRDFFNAAIDRVIARGENNDLKVNVCVKTLPVKGALVEVYPVSYERGFGSIETNRTLPNRSRGLYAYRQVTLSGYKAIPACSDYHCALNLMDFDRPLVRCSLVAGSETSFGGRCLTEDERSEKSECEADKP